MIYDYFDQIEADESEIFFDDEENYNDESYPTTEEYYKTRKPHQNYF